MWRYICNQYIITAEFAVEGFQLMLIHVLLVFGTVVTILVFCDIRISALYTFVIYDHLFDSLYVGKHIVINPRLLCLLTEFIQGQVCKRIQI